ncbi:MAG TPA: DNA-directed RNA polymerase subunit beta, partial [Vicinamibacteria bacterium]|nr:DNA-directed RNA polymerase subunit beta [Vicinamibacteria bacterium]
MQKLAVNPYRERVDFSRIRAMIPIPNLIEIQRKSYDRFLQMNLLASERQDLGLQAVFKSIFPITDFRENCELQFVEYAIGVWECKCGKLEGLQHLRRRCTGCGETVRTNPLGDREIPCPACGKPNENRGTVCDTCGDSVGLKLKYDVEECQERGMTYSVPLKVTIRLTVFDKDPDSGVRSIRDIKEQEVYFGDIPLMTDNGTFIINGTERVIVSQLHRSPGVFFHEVDKATNAFLAQIIPYRGSWVEFEFDQKNLLHVRIDRKRKFLATVFLRALGLRTNEDIIREFYHVDTIEVRGGKLILPVSRAILGRRFNRDIEAEGSNEPVVPAGKRITRVAIEKIEKAGLTEIELSSGDLEGASSVGDVVNTETGEVLVDCNEPLPADIVDMLSENGITKLEVFYPETESIGPILSLTARKDTIRTSEEALIEIYRRLRPGDPPTLESSRSLFQGMFFNPQKYDFSRVGRLKLSTKLELEGDLDQRLLEPKDFFAVIKYLLQLPRNIGTVDDIDHLGNRRVRSVGELLENQFRIGLVRMERAIKEKMSVYQEMATAMPHDLINAKPVMAAVREFFGSSQLSQFMDQTNPLSEVTHKRRLSALGPGGLSRERAGFEVRDVHPTHYGRICPIETPEGPNIGLISSLSCYARINEYGFIESPYKKVDEGRVLDHVQVTATGDSTFAVWEIVERRAFEREVSRIEKAGGRVPEADPHAFYLSAWEEDQHVIAQANAKVDDKGNLTADRVNCRQ